MNKENAHLYLPLVQAMAEGKTIQRNAGKSIVSPMKDVWVDADCIPTDINVEYYRVKPEPRKSWYRVAEMRCEGVSYVATSGDNAYSMSESAFEKAPEFVRWLTGSVCFTITEK